MRSESLSLKTNEVWPGSLLLTLKFSWRLQDWQGLSSDRPVFLGDARGGNLTVFDVVRANPARPVALPTGRVLTATWISLSRKILHLWLLAALVDTDECTPEIYWTDPHGRTSPRLQRTLKLDPKNASAISTFNRLCSHADISEGSLSQATLMFRLHGFSS